MSLEELASVGAEIKVSYDTASTRLHAKAWCFSRGTGFSTVYIGSSNLTFSAQVTGREWNVRASEQRNPRSGRDEPRHPAVVRRPDGGGAASPNRSTLSRTPQLLDSGRLPTSEGTVHVSNRVIHPGRRRVQHRRFAAAVAILSAALMVATAGLPTARNAGASPAPGAANPWLARRVVSLAHSAGNYENPDETIYAFGQATKDGVTILDLNVQITSDGVPVALHNDSVDKTTNGTGTVSTMTFADLHELDAAYWFTQSCWACTGQPEADYLYRGIRTGAVAPPAGYTADDFAIPSLEELFTRYPDAYMDIEIKDDGAKVSELAQKAAALIKQHGRQDRTIVASFGQSALDEFRSLDPTVATSATQDEVKAFFISGTVPKNAQILDVPPTYTLNGVDITVVSPAFVKKAHAAGLAVWVWPNDSSDENADFYGQLLDMGVDGINASQPAILVNLLRSRGVAWDPNAPTPPTTTAPTTTPPTPATTQSPEAGTAPPAVPTVANPTFTG